MIPESAVWRVEVLAVKALSDMFETDRVLGPAQLYAETGRTAEGKWNRDRENWQDESFIHMRPKTNHLTVCPSRHFCNAQAANQKQLIG